MSITEKLASLRDERLARIHACLLARDWVYGAWYDVEQNVTMDEWAQMVKREMINRRKKEMVTV